VVTAAILIFAHLSHSISHFIGGAKVEGGRVLPLLLVINGATVMVIPRILLLPPGFLRRY